MANRYAPDRRIRHHRRPAHRRAGRAWTARSTSSASRASTRRRSSPRCSTPSAAAASRSRRVLDGAARKQLYLPDTNVLLTRFLDADGVAEVSDFMPVEDAGQAHNLVRRAKTVRGEVRFQMRCDAALRLRARHPHGRAARATPRCSSSGASGDGELALRLRSSVPMRVEDGAALAEFTLRRRRRRPGSSSRWCCRGEPSPSRAARLRERRLQGDGELLAPLDRSQHLQGPLARDGEPLGADAEAAHLAAARLDRRRADVRSAGDDRRRAQLGLPLHVDPRLVVHALRADAPRLHATRRRRSCAG